MGEDPDLLVQHFNCWWMDAEPGELGHPSDPAQEQNKSLETPGKGEGEKTKKRLPKATLLLPEQGWANAGLTSGSGIAVLSRGLGNGGWCTLKNGAEMRVVSKCELGLVVPIALWFGAERVPQHQHLGFFQSYNR